MPCWLLTSVAKSDEFVKATAGRQLLSPCQDGRLRSFFMNFRADRARELDPRPFVEPGFSGFALRARCSCWLVC